MGLKTPEEYIEKHAGQALLPLSNLSACLEAILSDLGLNDTSRRKAISNSLIEEYSLRAGDQAVGVGALDRLVSSAKIRIGDSAGKSSSSVDSSAFDAEAKERALQAEAAAWSAPTDASLIPIATEDDIPTIDVSCLLGTVNTDEVNTVALENLASKLRVACQNVGFHFITNHGIASDVLDSAVAAAAKFSDLPIKIKDQYLMDTGRYPSGTGYLSPHSRKLPKRRKGNVVQAFIVKRELGPRNVTLDQMPWPTELGTIFRKTVEGYAAAAESLALRMLPAYALALGENKNYFTSAFQSPLWRLRMSRYPQTSKYEEDQYGIGPHVDTSFLTLLHRAEKEPGLVVWSAAAQRWVRAPTKPGALLVNSGEILRQISNDTFLSARHYVLNEGLYERTSLAFFITATADFKLPVAAGAGGGPAKYPPTSYLDGQGVIQGE